MKILLFLIPFSFLSAQSYYNLRDGFLDLKGEIESMKMEFAEESELTKTFDFILYSSQDDSLKGRVRFPRGDGPFPAALMCVGIETGKEVVAMIEGQDSVIVMAVDYPFEGEWDFKGWAAVGTTFRLRSMAYRAVPLLLNCLDWLFTHKNVAQNDVTVVAVSFGVFTAAPVAVIDKRVKQFVAVQAGGDLSAVLRHNSEKWGVSIPSWLVGWLGGSILHPFEPNKYIFYLSPRKLLMVNGEGDSFFPRFSAESLFDHAREPKEINWHKSQHVAPGEKELVKELTNLVARKLYGGR